MRGALNVVLFAGVGSFSFIQATALPSARGRVGVSRAEASVRRSWIPWIPPEAEMGNGAPDLQVFPRRLLQRWRQLCVFASSRGLASSSRTLQILPAGFLQEGSDMSSAARRIPVQSVPQRRVQPRSVSLQPRSADGLYPPTF